MNIKKLKSILVVVLVTVFTLAVCFFCSQTAYAASAESSATEIIAQGDEIEPTTPETPAPEQTPESGAQSITQSVQEYLKAIYGDDYEKYYNQIIENWGSIEKFLLNASENLPEETKYKATELLTTINAYIGVGADAILLLCVGIYIIYRAKKNKKVSTDLEKLKTAQNQTQAGELAIIDGLKAQSAALRELTPGERFAEVNARLAESEQALDSAAAEVKRNV